MQSLGVIEPSLQYGELLHRGRNAEIIAARIGPFDVVVKRPRTERATDRLLREADLLAAIRSQNVINLVALTEADDAVPVLVLPRYASSLRHTEPDTIEAIGGIATVASAIANGLAAVHAHGALHRDIHPGNVLYAADRQIVVSDLGHARPRDRAPLTPEGHTVGTVGYIAPEVLRGEPASHASEVYACGVTLFELITAQRPFEHPDPLVEMMRVQREHAFPLRTYVARLHVPPILQELIDAALSPSPASRPALADFHA